MFWTRDTKFLASNTGIGYSPISEMGTFLIGNAWKLESLGWNEFRTGSARVSAEISPRARCEICRAPAPNFGTRGEFPVAIARWQNYPHIWKLLLVIESFFFLFFLPRKQINLKVRARNLSDRWAILEIMGEKRKKFNRKIGRTKSQIWFPPAGAKFGWKRILTISTLNFLEEFSPPAWSIVPLTKVWREDWMDACSREKEMTAPFLFAGLFETDGVLIPGTMCDLEFVSSQSKRQYGRFYSPRYPSSYPKNIRCSYLFRAR